MNIIAIDITNAITPASSSSWLYWRNHIIIPGFRFVAQTVSYEVSLALILFILFLVIIW
jgi:hypothetical protein